MVGDYIKGQLIPDYDMLEPQVVLSDSLVRGKPTQIRLIGFLLDDFGISGSLEDVATIDPDNYDITIIPTKKDTLFFYQHILNPTPIPDEEVDYESLANIYPNKATNPTFLSLQ